MSTDYILDGKPYGAVAQGLHSVGNDPGFFRPYWNEKMRPAVSIRTALEEVRTENGGYVHNSDGSLKRKEKREEVLISELSLRGTSPAIAENATTLRKDQWIHVDQRVTKVLRERLRAWSDLRASSTIGGFDGYATTIYEYERMSDPRKAQVDMDGMTEGQNFTPTFDLVGTPLPITHSDFHISDRTLATSAQRGIPLSTVNAELASRAVAESFEKTLIGVQAGTTYGDSTDYAFNSQVFGYTNHPDRNTKSDMTVPDGTNGGTVLNDFLAAREVLFSKNSYGPYMIYTSTNWDQFLDNSFSTSEPSAGTLRSRLLEVPEFAGIRRLDFLPAGTSATGVFVVIFVEMLERTAAAINGMEVTTIQWDAMGGLRKNFKVMGIQVPVLKSDFTGQMGLLHATTPIT